MYFPWFVFINFFTSTCVSFLPILLSYFTFLSLLLLYERISWYIMVLYLAWTLSIVSLLNVSSVSTIFLPALHISYTTDKYPPSRTYSPARIPSVSTLTPTADFCSKMEVCF